MNLAYILGATTLVLGVGATLVNVVKTNSEAQNLLQTRETVSQVAFGVFKGAADLDNDGLVEMPGYLPSTTELEREQGVTFDLTYLPTTLQTSDSFGTALRYCVWNNGSITDSPYADANLADHEYLIGSDGNEFVQFAVLSAGLNRTFETVCADVLTNKAGNGDDMVEFKTTLQVKLGIKEGIDVNGGTGSGGDLDFYTLPEGQAPAPNAELPVASPVLAPVEAKFSGVYTNAGGPYRVATIGGVLDTNDQPGLLVAGFDSANSLWRIYAVGSNRYGQIGLGNTKRTSTPTEVLTLAGTAQDEPRIFKQDGPYSAVYHAGSVYVVSAFGEEEIDFETHNAQFSSFLGLGGLQSVNAITGTAPREFIRYGQPGTLNALGNYSFNGLSAPLEHLSFSTYALTGDTNGSKPGSLALDASGRLWGIKGGVVGNTTAANFAKAQFNGTPEYSVFSPIDGTFLIDPTGPLLINSNSYYVLDQSVFDSKPRAVRTLQMSSNTSRNLTFSGGTTNANNLNIWATVDSSEETFTLSGRVHVGSPFSTTTGAVNGNVKETYKVPGGVRNLELCPEYMNGSYSLGVGNPRYKVYAINKEGFVYQQNPSEGSGDIGSIGVGAIGNPPSPVNDNAVGRVASLANIHYMACATDPEYQGSGAYFVDSDGRLFAIGNTAFGVFVSPTEISRPNNLKVVGIYSAPASVYALLEDGSLWGAGSNYHGQLGRPYSKPYSQFVQIFSNLFTSPSPVGLQPADPSVPAHIPELLTFANGPAKVAVINNTLADRSTGQGVLMLRDNIGAGTREVVAAGANTYGQLGGGVSARLASPTVVLNLPGLSPETRVFSSSLPIGIVNHGTDVYMSSRWATEPSLRVTNTATALQPKIRDSALFGLGDLNSTVDGTNGPTVFTRYGAPGTLNSQGNFSFNGLTAPLRSVAVIPYTLEASRDYNFSYALDDDGNAWSVKGGRYSSTGISFSGDLFEAVFAKNTSNFLLNSTAGNVSTNGYHMLGERFMRYGAARIDTSVLQITNATNVNGTGGTILSTNTATSITAIGEDEHFVSKIGARYFQNPTGTVAGANDQAFKHSFQIPFGVRNSLTCPRYLAGEYQRATANSNYGLVTTPATDLRFFARHLGAGSTNSIVTNTFAVDWIVNKRGSLYFSGRSATTVAAYPGSLAQGNDTNLEVNRILGVSDAMYLACGSDISISTSGLYIVTESGQLLGFGGTVFGIFTGPQVINVPAGHGTVQGVYSGPGVVYVLMADGAVYGAGNNSSGQLGVDPAVTPSSTSWVRLI